MKESPIDCDQFFVPHCESTEVAYPCNGAFYFPASSIPSELSAVLDFGLCPIFSMRSNKIYSSLFQFFAKCITVIRLVANETFRALLGSARSVSGHLNLFKRLGGKFHFRGRCRGKGASQRNTLAVRHDHPLRALALFGFPDARPPFFAGAKLPSMKASCQSKAPFASSWARKARQISSQIPISSHSFRRRQQVDELGYLLGRSSHLAPVLSIQRIPSRTCRLSAGGLPPLGLSLGFGNNGSTLFHCSSFKNRVFSAIGSPPIAYYTKIHQMSSF